MNEPLAPPHAGLLPHPTQLDNGEPSLSRPGWSQVTHAVAADARWSFALPLPERAERVALSDDMPAPGALAHPLALFRWGSTGGGEAGGAEADVEVLGHHLQHEVDAADWLEHTLKGSGREVVSRRPAQTLEGAVGDLLLRWAHDGVAYTGRYVALKWGPRVFVVCCRCREADYPALALDFLAVAAGFEALEPGDVAFAEDVWPFSADTPVPWKVVVPASWSVVPRPPMEDGTWFEAVQFRQEGSGAGYPAGRLGFAVMSRSVARRPRDAGNVLLNSLRDNGVALEHTDFVACEADARFDGAWQLVTAVTRQGATRQGGAGEVRCRVMMSKRLWVLAGVVGPRSADEPEAWMRNKRVLDVVTSTLELG